MTTIKSDNFEHLGIRINNTKPRINLINIYRKPYGKEKKRVWNEIFDFNHKNYPTIIAGDINAHNTGWNCPTTDDNGENLMETLEDQGFTCLNIDTLSRIGELIHSQKNY